MADQNSEGLLVLVRHGESLWNAKQLWTGFTDIGLSEKGEEEARSAAAYLTDITFDCAFTSRLIRAQETLRIILESLGIQHLPVTRDAALNERDYGIYTGKNKEEVRKELGEVDFLRLRRGWDYPIPRGESLKQVYERVVPYYEKHILPLLRAGQHVLIAAHGNSLRALMKYLEHISDADISGVELATGDIVMYRVNTRGEIESKEIRKTTGSV